jgi:hypothetical protein
LKSALHEPDKDYIHLMGSTRFDALRALGAFNPTGVLSIKLEFDSFAGENPELMQLIA